MDLFLLFYLDEINFNSLVHTYDVNEFFDFKIEIMIPHVLRRKYILKLIKNNK